VYIQGNVTLCYDILFIATARVYWMTQWSLKKCHIQTVVINMNSHGNGIYLSVLIKYFPFPLKRYFISKTNRCFWLTLYNQYVKWQLPMEEQRIFFFSGFFYETCTSSYRIWLQEIQFCFSFCVCQAM
jgi:hypothetical protein